MKSTDTKETLLGKTPSELTAIAKEIGLPSYAGKQLALWLYQKRAASIAEMTNISLTNRNMLEERYQIGLSAPVAVSESVDGTKKYLFRTTQGSFIESAYIPDGDRATLCVSSQAGCRMGCTFCMTGRQGLQHNLTAGDILNQILSIPESQRLTNIVYMGMGEPLDNIEELMRSLEILTSSDGFGWSPSRITVSTIGVIPALRTLLDGSRVHLAVSLHNPFPDQRVQTMPVEKAWPAAEVVRLLKEYDFSGQRRVSFEYIVFKGVNDSPAHVKALASLLDGLKCRINLIRFHSVEGSGLSSPDEQAMIRMRDALTRKGIITTIRSSRGEDIQAACGLLSTSAQIASAKQ